MSQPGQLDSPLCQLPHKEGTAGFTAHKPKNRALDLGNGDCRGSEPNALDRHAALLEGASLAPAQMSGADFPAELSADERLESVTLGTRLRHRTR